MKLYCVLSIPLIATGAFQLKAGLGVCVAPPKGTLIPRSTERYRITYELANIDGLDVEHVAKSV
jgi:hypothetical protein